MAFGGGLDDDNNEMSEINMTPLVDVMLVLLIIFILTVPVITHAVKVDLPKADNVLNEIKPKTIALTVDAEARIHWNDDIVDLAELEQRLQAVAQQEPQPEVHLRGDKAVAYEHVIQVMALVQRSGIHQLGFITEPVN